MEIENKIKDIVSLHVDVALDTHKIQDNDFLDVLGINSINFMRIVIEIEEMYGCEFDVDMLGFDVYSNFGDFVKYVKKIVSEN